MFGISDNNARAEFREQKPDNFFLHSARVGSIQYRVSKIESHELPLLEEEEEREKGRGKRTQRLLAFRRFFDLPQDNLHDGKGKLSLVPLTTTRLFLCISEGVYVRARAFVHLRQARLLWVDFLSETGWYQDLVFGWIHALH